ncbi:MAG: hypothetical protein JRN15_13740 [Nitrososphaerota archaeon]|nr:hypothetical protein [Nitrososphaerota archaeon]
MDSHVLKGALRAIICAATELLYLAITWALVRRVLRAIPRGEEFAINNIQPAGFGPPHLFWSDNETNHATIHQV